MPFFSLPVSKQDIGPFFSYSACKKTLSRADISKGVPREIFSRYLLARPIEGSLTLAVTSGLCVLMGISGSNYYSPPPTTQLLRSSGQFLGGKQSELDLDRMSPEAMALSACTEPQGSTTSRDPRCELLDVSGSWVQRVK